MDFSGVTEDTSTQVFGAVEHILSLDISPADKQARIAKVIESVGSYYHTQMYDAASEVFGSTTMASAGIADTDAQAQRLANKIVRNYALTRDISPLVKEYYDSVLGRAQHEAFKNAASLQKHPTLTRTIVGETCAWCDSKAGTYTNPQGEYFARHRECDCLFTVSGYNTRNGIINNYVKK